MYLSLVTLMPNTKTGLTYSDRTDGSQSILLRWLTFLLVSMTAFIVLLDLFIYHNCSISFTVSSPPPLANSDHVVVCCFRFYEWVHFGINVYMPHRKYQAKSHHRLNHFVSFVPTN